MRTFPPKIHKKVQRGRPCNPPQPSPPTDVQLLIRAVERIADALEARPDLDEHLAGLRELNSDLEGIATALEQQAAKSKDTAAMYPPQP